MNKTGLKTALTAGLAALLTANTVQAEEKPPELPYNPDATVTGGMAYNIEEKEAAGTFDLTMKEIPISPCIPFLGCLNFDLEGRAQMILYRDTLSQKTGAAGEFVHRFSLFSHYLSADKRINKFVEFGPSFHLLRPYDREALLFGGGFVRLGVNGEEAHHVLLGVEGNGDSLIFNAGYYALTPVNETVSVGAYVGGITPSADVDGKNFRRDSEFAGSFQFSPRVDIEHYTIQGDFKLDGFSDHAYKHGGKLPVQLGLKFGANF